MKEQLLMLTIAVALLVISSILLPVCSYADSYHKHSEHGVGIAEETIPLALRLYRYVQPLGIATYSSLWITFLLGLLKFKLHVRSIGMRWHYGFAILTLILATLHASLVLYMNYL